MHDQKRKGRIVPIADLVRQVVIDDLYELAARDDFHLGLMPRSVEIRWMEDDELIRESWIHLGLAQEATYTLSLSDQYDAVDKAQRI